MHVLKGRGMAHSNQLREFLITARGIELQDAYIGPEGVLTGSMRQAQEARGRAAAVARAQEIERRQRELERKREVMEARIAAIRREFEAEEEAKRVIGQERRREELLRQDREQMAASRHANGEASPGRSPGASGDRE